MFVLSGRIETQAIAELQRLFECHLFQYHTDHCDMVVDLKDVSLVGRDVMGFLSRCEADGADA